VIRLIFFLFILLLSHCSFNESTRLWKDKETEIQPNIKKLFEKNKISTTEFNQDLKLDLTKVKTNSLIVDNKNNFGVKDYIGEFKKIGRYKFLKFDDVNQLDFQPIFLNNGLIFFDKKGSIIRYEKNQKILWKVNHYTKSEKKLEPKLNFVLDGTNLLVTDNIAKYYSIDINSGKLNWSKNNTYPFNSEIKKYKNKIFAIDYSNTLRCYNINDGNECWNLQTDKSFTISGSKFSLILIDNTVVFNNSIGDITAADIESGLIKWQLPTQSYNILDNTYSFKISKLVSDGNSVFFSNNKNEFYSIDVKTGTINWINEINSNLTPILSNNLLFTVSSNGFLYVVEKNKGNILRITDLYKNDKIKKRKNIEPIGFAIGNSNLYLTNSDGKLIVVDLSLGKVIRIEKVSGDLISVPFILNKNLFVIRNGSIVQYN
jgi:outer membrane protein assembly factor BamB